MKGTLISILVGAVVGALLTLGSGVHASHAAASRTKHAGTDIVAPAPVAPDAVSHPSFPPATPSEQSPLQK
jgi:hypothetical protein